MRILLFLVNILLINSILQITRSQYNAACWVIGSIHCISIMYCMPKSLGLISIPGRRIKIFMRLSRTVLCLIGVIWWIFYHWTYFHLHVHIQRPIHHPYTVATPTPDLTRQSGDPRRGLGHEMTGSVSDPILIVRRELLYHSILFFSRRQQRTWLV